MKKNLTSLVSLLVLLSAASVIILFLIISTRKQHRLMNSLRTAEDSSEHWYAEKLYLAHLFDLTANENNRHYVLDTVRIFSLADGKPVLPTEIGKLSDAGRQKLIVRYTEIGCNACADSTLNILKKEKRLKDMFDVFVFVDFTDYNAYLKWRKLSEIDFPVFWLKKGDLPFGIERQNSSYLFTVNNHEVDNFFVPNSLFPAFIHKYISGLGHEI